MAAFVSGAGCPLLPSTAAAVRATCTGPRAATAAALPSVRALRGGAPPLPRGGRRSPARRHPAPPVMAATDGAAAAAPPAAAAAAATPPAPSATTTTTTAGGARPAGAARTTPLPFRKYQGLGNDFILLDNRSSPALCISPAQAVALCDRHTGIGGDGVIFLLPPNVASGAAGADCTATMRIINADGSEPEMCGNGVRCLAVYAADLGMDVSALVLDTLAGRIVPSVLPGGAGVRVDMGVPVTEPPSAVPTTLPAVTAAVTVAGRDWTVTGVSMGNPHAVTFVSAAEWAAVDADLERVGPLFEGLTAVFPARVNTEFVTVDAPDAVRMVVWERGAGRTRACGTGACAVVVAGVLTGATGREVTVGLPGGDLFIEWSEADGRVYMTGPAELAFEGTVMV